MKSTFTGAETNPPGELQLLIEWPNPLAVFAGNLGERLRGRVVPEFATTSQPDYDFWRDIDLRTPLPRRGLVDSVFAHVALFGLLYVIWVSPSSMPHFSDPLARRTFEPYALSEYLPELHGAPTHAHGRPTAKPGLRAKQDPVKGKQEIVSLPENPDNLRQTIVTPPKLNLSQDVNLPNIVAYQPVPPIQPLQATERRSASLRLPTFTPEVIAPAADTGSLHSRSKIPSLTPRVIAPTPDMSLAQTSRGLPTFQPKVVEPAPDVAQGQPRPALPAFQPKIVEPAPELGQVSRQSSANLAHLTPRIPAPIPEPPRMADQYDVSVRIMALNLHPAEIQKPVQLPSGNRSGSFAASPNGRVDATGTPGAPAEGPSGSNVQVNAPAGITVNSGGTPAAPIAAPDQRAKLMAAMRPPSLASIPRRQPVARESGGPLNEVERKLFAERRSYTLSVNMPNLNAATGSWIIHFAESDPGGHQSPIAAPEVLSKDDPAFPGDLIQDGVQGTVILTAIIRADGSVGNIVVAKGLDPRLDRNAATAFSHWLFRPALKDGRAIDLQAVIMVPFRAKAPGL